MHTNPSRMTSLLALNSSRYSVLMVSPPSFLRESVPQLWSHLGIGDSVGGQNGSIKQAQTFHNRQCDCLVYRSMIGIYLIVKHLSIRLLNVTLLIDIGEVRTSASISSSVKSAVNSALSPKLSSPRADVGGSALELSGASGGLDGPASSAGGSAAASLAAAAFFALSLWLRRRSTVVDGPADVLASGCSGGLVEERLPDVTPARAASMPLRRDPLNIRPETRGRR
jgi:hypothetical protein